MYIYTGRMNNKRILKISSKVGKNQPNNDSFREKKNQMQTNTKCMTSFVSDVLRAMILITSWY